MKNLWFNKLVAFAYQKQREALPYREMLKIFSLMYNIKGGEEILDIGCGSGRLMKLSLEKQAENSQKIKKIVGIDCSPDALFFAKKNLLQFKKSETIFDFSEVDINNNLPFSDKSFDIVTAGLSLQYAEYWDEENNQWTDKNYKKIFYEIKRVLKPSGKLIFSVNVPNPDFSIIAKKSWKEIFLTWKFPLMIFVAIVMVVQGRWLTKQANIGRFHYLPIEKVISILSEAGYKDIHYKLTYAGLAWVVSCES